MIKEKIKILLVEDNPADVTLVKHQIKKIAKNAVIHYTSSFDKFMLLLDDFEPDILLSDYRLNTFTGIDVLKYTQNKKPHLPFIFVTSAMEDEELAASTILNGASDFVLKNNMNKLHNKLLPHFERIIERKNANILPVGHQEILDEIQKFLKNADEENAAHKESFLQIKRDLEKFRSTQND